MWAEPLQQTSKAANLHGKRLIVPNLVPLSDTSIKGSLHKEENEIVLLVKNHLNALAHEKSSEY